MLIHFSLESDFFYTIVQLMLLWVLFFFSYSRYHLASASIFTMLCIYRVTVTATIENLSQKNPFFLFEQNWLRIKRT